MNPRLTLSTLTLLVLPPLLWASNAVVGYVLVPQVPPLTLNFLRWALAFLLLLPLAAWALKRGSPVWRGWRRYALVGLLGVGCYNALQYMALKTSTPLNATLVSASSPIFMLAIGALFFGQRITRRQAAGTLLSLLGVALVLLRGDWTQLAQLRLVPGDLYMLVATAAWAWYSWLLAQPADSPELRRDWAGFLMAQLVYGLGWSGLFAAGEWAVAPQQILWSWTLGAALLYVAVGPALLAYRFWGVGVQRAGPALASFFGNLTPLFAAVLSAALLGELPRLYHGLAFLLIVGGILACAPGAPPRGRPAQKVPG